MRTSFVVYGVALSLLGVSGAWGCVVIVDDVAESGSETSTSGDGDGDGDSTGDGDGDSTGDGDGDGTGDGDGDGTGDGDGDASGDGDGDPTGDGDCAPENAELQLSYQLEGLAGEGFEALDYDWTCTLTAIDQQDGLHLELDCPEAIEPVVIDVAASPGIPGLNVDPGAALKLRHVYDGPWWFNLYLRLDHELGGHLLTLVDGDALDPGDLYDFTLPFPTAALEGQCPSGPLVCGSGERMALGFELDGDSWEVFDHTHAIIGPPPGHDVWVREATRLHQIDCTDTPPDWYRLLIVSPGGG